VITVEEALARLFALAAPLSTETIPLRHAAGRYMATPARALRDQPPFPASAMDGYAIAADPTPGAQFTVIGEAGAGHAFQGQIGPGQALRIFTGAPIPEGATCVVIQEDVIRDGERITLGEGVNMSAHIAPGVVNMSAHIRPAGQDFKAGSSLSPRRLTAHELALLAAMNVPTVTVTRRPVVAIIPTGDELVMPGEVPKDDQIIASNSFAIAALAEAAGAEVRMLPIARDTVPALTTVLGLAEGADVVVTIGGASVGDHDLVARVAGSLGFAPAFWKIAMRPGKPLMAGRFGPDPGGGLMLGLPGNPVSAIVCAHLFLLPLLRLLQGGGAVPPAARRARLGCDVEANGPRAHYMRAVLSDDLATVTPFDRQDSSLLSILTQANALLIRPIGDAARKAGEKVEYLPLTA
jgi:molybdopterin molybdotransferase